MLPWARASGGGMRAASIGVRVSATNSENITAAATVTPNSPRNEPTRPSTKITGRKTTAMERVAAVAAKAIWRVPFEAASKGASPASRCRSMFSSTTMASSITTPTARARASRVMMLRVAPKIHITPKLAMMESGMAVATMSVGRVRRRKTKTTRVARKAPKTSANWVSATESRMDWEKSMMPSQSAISMPAGANFFSSSTRSRTSVAIATVFAWDCFRTPMPAPWPPLKRARKRSVLGAVLHPGHVPKSHLGAVDVRDDEVGELVDGLELGVGLERVLDLAALDPTAGPLHVLALHGFDHVARGEVARAHGARRRARCGWRGPAARRSRWTRRRRSSRCRASSCSGRTRSPRRRGGSS